MPKNKRTWQKCKFKKSANAKLIRAQSKSRRFKTESVYLCPHNMYIDGTTYFKVDAVDTANARNRLGVTQIILLINGRIIFHVNFDRIKSHEKYWGSRVYDRGMTGFYPARYAYKMFGGRPRGKRVPRLPSWVKEARYNGYLDTSGFKLNSVHILDVVVIDGQGNISVGKINLIKKQGKRPTWVRPKYNLAAGRAHTVTAGLLSVTTPYLRRKARLEIVPYKKKTPGHLKKISKAYRIVWSNGGNRGQLSYAFRSRRLRRRAVFNAWGKDLKAKYKSGAYRGTLKWGGTFMLADDVAAPTFHYPNIYGPLEQDLFLLRIVDKGLGIDEGSIQVFVNGERLNRGQMRGWGIYYDNDRKGIFIPTGFKGLRDTYQHGKMHLLWVRACDKAGNSSRLWQGYIHLRI